MDDVGVISLRFGCGYYLMNFSLMNLGDPINQAIVDWKKFSALDSGDLMKLHIDSWNSIWVLWSLTALMILTIRVPEI